MKSFRHLLLIVFAFCLTPAWASGASGPAAPDLSAADQAAAQEAAKDAIEKKLASRLELPDLLEFAYRSNPSITASKESWQG